MASSPDPAGATAPSPLRRAARNFGRLLRGRGIAAVLELLTIALLARTLSPANLGFVVLIQAYALAIRGLLQFNMYEVLVRFGVPLLEAGDTAGFRRLIRLTIGFDVASSVAAALIALAGVPLASAVLGWEPSFSGLAMLYSLALLTYGYGTAKGVLRIFDRYDTLSVQLTIAPVLRLAGVALAWWQMPTVTAMVVALLVATIAGDVFLILKGWGELKRQTGVPQAPGWSALRGWSGRYPGLRSFLGIVYWQSNLDMMPKYLSTLLAGFFLGPAAAGFLRLCNEAAKILSKPGALIGQVLLPDLMRLWLRQSGDFEALLSRALAVSGLLGLGFTVGAFFGGSFVLTRGLGDAYREAGPLLNLMFAAATLDLLANVLRQAGYAMGHAGKILRLHLLSAAMYLLAFVTLTPPVGLPGPGLAACLGALVPVCGIGWIVRRTIAREGRAAQVG